MFNSNFFIKGISFCYLTMRVIKPLLYLYAVLCMQVANSQTRSTLSGTVRSAETHQPLPGASIQIYDINRHAIADENGEYKSSSLPSGKYLVEVSFVGYGTIVESVTIDGNTIRDFHLSAAVVEQEGVTVTGVSAATRIKQSPQPVMLVKRVELMKVSSTNIIGSLSQIPGVSAASTGPAIAKPFIRGLGYNRVLVVHDGVRQEGQQWGDEHGIEIDDYSVQRVEVMKGPASLIYGSDALAGVINIQTLSPVAEGRLNVNLLGEYQSNSRLRGYYGNFAGTKNGFSFNAYGSYKAAEDYKNRYDGYVFNSKFNNKSFGTLLGYGGSWGHSFARITYFDQKIGMIEGERDDATGQFLKPVSGGDEVIAGKSDFHSIEPSVPYQHVKHLKLSSENNFNLGRNKLNLIAGFQRNQRMEYGDPDNDKPEAYFDLKTVNYTARINVPFNSVWKNSIGVSGMLQWNKNRAEEALIPDYRLWDIGAFIFSQYNKKRLSVSGGFRFDNRHVAGEEMYADNEIRFARFNRNFFNLTATAGVSYEIGKELNLKFNLARGFRAPTLAELASNGAHEGTNRFEIGNPDLRSETSLQADAGIDYNSDHITLGIGAFYNRVSNFIYYRKLVNSSGNDSLLTDPDSGDLFQVFQFDQQTAHLYGVEFHMDLHPHPLDWLHFENTFSVTRARFSQNIDGSRNVPNIPAAKLLSQLKANFLSKGQRFRNLYASLESDFAFRQNHAFTGYNTETPTASYWLIHASIGISMVRKGQDIATIHFSADNLTNQAYQDHQSRLKYTAINNVTGRQGVFNRGRNYTIKLSIPLSFEWN